MTIVIPKDAAEFKELLDKFINADHPDKRISLVTDTPYQAFDVPEALARHVGVLPAAGGDDESPPVPETATDTEQATGQPHTAVASQTVAGPEGEEGLAAGANEPAPAAVGEGSVNDGTDGSEAPEGDSDDEGSEDADGGGDSDSDGDASSEDDESQEQDAGSARQKSDTPTRSKAGARKKTSSPTGGTKRKETV